MVVGLLRIMKCVAAFIDKNAMCKYRNRVHSEAFILVLQNICLRALLCVVESGRGRRRRRR